MPIYLISRLYFFVVRTRQAGVNKTIPFFWALYLYSVSVLGEFSSLAIAKQNGAFQLSLTAVMTRRYVVGHTLILFFPVPALRDCEEKKKGLTNREATYFYIYIYIYMYECM